MRTEERRAAILRALHESDTPQSATALATRFSVSRQIIVGDVALLRAGGDAIIATPGAISWIIPLRGSSAGWRSVIGRKRCPKSYLPWRTPGAPWPTSSWSTPFMGSSPALWRSTAAEMWSSFSPAAERATPSPFPS